MAGGQLTATTPDGGGLRLSARLPWRQRENEQQGENP